MDTLKESPLIRGSPFARPTALFVTPQPQPPATQPALQGRRGRGGKGQVRETSQSRRPPPSAESGATGLGVLCVLRRVTRQIQVSTLGAPHVRFGAEWLKTSGSNDGSPKTRLKPHEE